MNKCTFFQKCNRLALKRKEKNSHNLFLLNMEEEKCVKMNNGLNEH